MKNFNRITYFQRNGLTFQVIDEGPIDGEVVILLHGFPQRASSWRKVMKILNKAGYRTIAPDQRGYSKGARPKGRRAYRVSELSLDIVQLIQQLNVGAVHLVGHDWGSFVASNVAGKYPELVKTLTTVSLPHPKAFVRSLFTSKQILHSWYMLFFQLPGLPEFLMKNMRSLRNKMLRDGGMDDDLISRYEKEMIEEDALKGGINWYRAMLFFGRAPHITVPTTHIWGDHDVSLERKGAEYSEKYVDSRYRLEIIKNGTHWLPDQSPEQLSKLLIRSFG